MTVGDSGSTCTCTTQVGYVDIPYFRDPKRRVIIVDTPGFNEIRKYDDEILRELQSGSMRSEFPFFGCKFIISDILYFKFSRWRWPWGCYLPP